MSSRTSRRHGTRQRSGPVRPGLVGALLVLLAAVLLPAGPAAADEAPQITVVNPRIAVDDQIKVVGRGFEARQSITLEVCGAPDATGRLTCSPMTAAFDAPLNGSFAEDVVMAAPTGACPCLIAVRIPGSPPVTATIDLLNHPVADRVQTPELVVDRAHVAGAAGLLSLFTGRASAELELDLRNVGVTEASPMLLLAVAPQGDGGGEAIDDPGVAAIGPETSRTVSVPMEFGSPGGGTHVVSGYVVVGDMYAPVTATATVRPWGLYLVLAVGLVLALRAVVRRRRSATPAPGVTPARRPTHQAPGRRAARDPRRPKVPGLNVGEMARAASEASRVAAEAIAKVRAAEKAERREQVAAARAETDEQQIEARLEALTQGVPSLPAGQAPSAPGSVAPPAGPAATILLASSPGSGSPDRAPTPVEVPHRTPEPMIGPPRLERTPIARRGEPLTQESLSTLPGPEFLAQPPEFEAAEATPGPGSSLVSEPAGAMAIALQARAAEHRSVPDLVPEVAQAQGPSQAVPAADTSVVAEAMAAIRVHTADAPARLPDPHAYVPVQRDRRAPKGGKRAAR